MSDKKPQSKTIEVVVNGKVHELADGFTVGGLLEKLGVPRVGTAVELGGEVLLPAKIDSTVLIDGHSLEIVRLVGGG